MASITTALGSVKRDLGRLLEPAAIERLCRTAGHRWRERLLDPVTTLLLLVLQVLEGNLACAALRHLSPGRPFSAAAYCRARRRLPVAVLGGLLTRTAAAAGAGPGTLWRGLRTFTLDGTGVSMPDTPALAARYGYPANQKPGCGFPMARLALLFEACSGAILALAESPWDTAELSLTPGLHARLGPGDLLVGDRVFGSYGHLALLAARGVEGLFRLSGARRCLPARGEHDRLVSWDKPKRRPPWIEPGPWADLPPRLDLRVLRYRVRRRGFRTREVTLVTTLRDAGLYPKAELAELYRRRWDVEINLRHLKQSLGMDVLHGRTPETLTRELLAFALVYNLVRLVWAVAARRLGVAPRRVSFADAWHFLRFATPGRALPPLRVLPERPGRVEPRVLKRRPHPRTYMTKPRAVLRRALLKPRPAA
jgi:hypothetical protein